MRKFLTVLVLIAIACVGCSRNSDVATIDNSMTAPSEGTAPFYSVAEYDPDRDANADLLATVQQATDGNKRIILEIGGHW